MSKAIPLRSLFFSLLIVLPACGELESVGHNPQSLAAGWRPFASDSPWNRRLSASRNETPLSSRVMGTGAMGFADDQYGIGFYAASGNDAFWTIQYDGYNNGSSYDSDGSLRLRGPSGMQPPTGSDGTVILVDEAERYSYEMWRFERQGSGRATAAYVVRVDLATSGVREGITGGGAPAIGGVLREDEVASGAPIRHKLWVAAHPDIVYARSQWPALRHDARGDGRYATLTYGDVIALSKDYSFGANPCGLSPFMQRLARVLQDYGGIVVDKGGDSLGFPTAVGAIRRNIDIDYDVAMWNQLRCLKGYMVRVGNPWSS